MELLNEVRDGGRTRASDTELNADSMVVAHADGHLRSSVFGLEITKNKTRATGGAGSLRAKLHFLKRKQRKG